MAKKDKGAIALPYDLRFCFNLYHCLCFLKLEKIKSLLFYSEAIQKDMGDFVILTVFGFFLPDSLII